MQVSQLSSPRAHPVGRPSFLVLPLVLPVVVSLTWSRPSPWLWPRHVHARTFALNHALMYSRTCTGVG
jgi:hypothetical protein